MLHSVRANMPSFHSVEFTSGLNVILADRDALSDKKETRNGLGKTTLLEVIDFCLGGSIQKGKGLGKEALKEWIFTIEISLGESRVEAIRALASPNRIIIRGNTKGWIIQPQLDEDDNEKCLNIEDWKRLLGYYFFKLKPTETKSKHRPTLRSLLSYFIRLGPDAYSDPFSYFRQQSMGDIQLNMAFLIGLNWRNASKWQELKEKYDALSALDKAIKAGLQKTAGELEAEKVRLEKEFELERTGLVRFRVHEQYEKVQSDANRLTRTVHEKSDENSRDKNRLSLYEEASAAETVPEDEKIEDIYKQAGFLFPESVKRTLAEAKDFHIQVVHNRKSFLAIEIENIKRRIDKRTEEIRSLAAQKADLMEILNTHGALEEFVRLQELHAKTKQELDGLKQQIAEIRDRAKQLKDIKADRIELSKKAEIDYEEKRDLWENAVRKFNDFSQELYNSPGQLVIDISDKGYSFDVEIQRSDSEGIGKMKLFCFDLVLASLWAETFKGIDFLIHDSLVFDGVDVRQRAIALEMVARTADKSGFQYICTLNSDMIPTSDFSEGFDFDRYVRLHLEDEVRNGIPVGSLFGISF